MKTIIVILFAFAVSALGADVAVRLSDAQDAAIAANLTEYNKTVAAEKRLTKDAFVASIVRNYLEPKAKPPVVAIVGKKVLYSPPAGPPPKPLLVIPVGPVAEESIGEAVELK